jgi:hypothetical protein
MTRVTLEVLMPVNIFDHVNIRTMKLSETLSFFRDVLKLKITPAPGRTDLMQVAWIIGPDDDVPFHVAHGEEPYLTDDTLPWPPTNGGGPIHHIALKCAGFGQMRADLDEFDVEYGASAVPRIRLQQPCVREPNGIDVDLNVFNSPPAS